MSDNDRSASNNGFNNTTSYKGNLASSRSLFGKGKIKPTFGMTVSNVKTVRLYNNHTDQVDKYQPQKLNNFTNLMMYSNNNREGSEQLRGQWPGHATQPVGKEQPQNA